MRSGMDDLIETFKNPNLFLFLAMSDIKARYKRSVLGPLWITISTAIGVVGLGIIWSALFHLDRTTYIPTLTVGLILWQFLSSSVVEASTLFTRYAGIIRNIDLPLSMYSSLMLTRQLIVFAHNIPLFFLVVVCVGFPVNAHMLLFFPAMLLVIANLYWMITLIGILGARFRDLEYLIATVMPLLMFFTPVMYRPNALPFSPLLTWLNPLADMIEMVRHPLLGEPIPLSLVVINIAMLIVGGAVTMYLFNAKRRRIALWV